MPADVERRRFAWVVGLVRVRRAGAAAAACALAATGLVIATAAPAAAEPGVCESIDAQTGGLDETTDASAPLVQMQVDEAHDYVERTGDRPVPGEGIGVAVIDSGISDSSDIEEAGELTPQVETNGPVTWPQGSIAAGLIVGEPREPDEDDAAEEDLLPTGIAPGADVYDVRVYDTVPEQGTTDGSTYPSSEALAAGLRSVLENLDPPSGDPVRIVNVSMQVAPTQEIDDLVTQLYREGVLVVAASGDRPLSDDTAELSQYFLDGGPVPPGEDARRDVAPASSKDAIAVSAVPGDPDVSTGTDEVVSSDADPAAVLRNGETDLVAPTVGGVSYGLNGLSCVVEGLSSRWAAAEVSGVLAMVWSYYGPDEVTAAQVRAIVERTATGNGVEGEDGERTSGSVTGFGTVQPYEALTTSLRPDRRGELPTMEADIAGEEPATAPVPETDVLASTRRNAVWWGLVGGAALIVALILRPLLSRRRV